MNGPASASHPLSAAPPPPPPFPPGIDPVPSPSVIDGFGSEDEREEAITPAPAAARPEAPHPDHFQRGPAWLGVLRFVHYRNVWIAAFFSNIGNWMEQVGVQMVVAKETGSLRMLGVLAIAQLTPILLLGTIGGLFADRVNRRTLLVVTQAMLMVIAGLIAAVSLFGPPTVVSHSFGFFPAIGVTSDLVAALLVLSVIYGIIMAFNMPAWQVLTPRLVPRHALTKAITLNGIQFNAARAVGPAIAGLIMGLVGTTPLFIINTLSFLGVVLTVSRTPSAPAPPHTGESPLSRVAAACSFLFRQKGPRLVFFATVLMSLFAAPLVRILPLYVIDVYRLKGTTYHVLGMDTKAEDFIFGMMLAVLGIGAVLGGFALRLIPSWYPKHHFIPIALLCCGLSIGLVALTTSAGWGLAAMFICGIFWIWGFNQSWAALQHLVSDHMRGRVLAIANVFSFGVTALGNLAAGWFGDAVGIWAQSEAVGTRTALATLGIILLCAGIVMLIWREPEVDGLKPGDPGYDKRPGLWRGLTAAAHRPCGPNGQVSRGSRG